MATATVYLFGSPRKSALLVAVERAFLQAGDPGVVTYMSSLSEGDQAELIQEIIEFSGREKAQQVGTIIMASKYSTS